jgi:hypothetical protein
VGSSGGRDIAQDAQLDQVAADSVGQVKAAGIHMSKDAPTLADMMLMMAFDKRLQSKKATAQQKDQRAQYRRHLLSVANARKFVLDDAMSKFVLDIENGLGTRGGLRKRTHELENARMLSRLPHHLTFIEMNYRAYLARANELGIKLQRPDNKPLDHFDLNKNVPARIGWIFQQLPQYGDIVTATEVRSSVYVPYAAMIHPVSMAWTVDNNGLPIQTIQLYADDGTDQSYLLAMIRGYKTDRAGWIPTFRHPMAMEMAKGMGVWDCKPTMTARAIWGLLSTINDLPVVMEHVEPSRGFMARGNYRKFLKHSIVRLTVPETRWKKLIMKAATLVRRRAHQVRGHWRNDWRHPLTVKCEHVYTSRDGCLVCVKCQGRKLHIAEHVRGDASLGFVTHDYEVTKRAE